MTPRLEDGEMDARNHRSGNAQAPAFHGQSRMELVPLASLVLRQLSKA